MKAVLMKDGFGGVEKLSIGEIGLFCLLLCVV